MAAPATCTGFVSNPSVFGWGVRIGFYVTGILAAITPIKSSFSPQKILEIANGIQKVEPKRELSGVVAVQGVNGLGLLVTAVIQTALGKLSLYHAFLIINLLFLLSTSFLYFLFNPDPVLRRREFFVVSLVFLAIFSLFVGLTAHKFGSQPECNNTVKIIWIFRVSTASFLWFRNFGITIFAIYIAVVAIHLVQLFFFRQRIPDLGVAPAKAFRAYGLAVLAVNLLLIGIIEATIAANKVPNDNSWSFGQTLPIVMLIGPLWDTWDDNFPLVKALWHKRQAASYSTDDTPLISYSPKESRSIRSEYFAIDKQT